MKKAVLLVAAVLLQQQAAAANLGGMALCMGAGYRIDGIQRQTQRPGFRTVETGNGKALVSAVDGFRMEVYGEGLAPVGNLKFEASQEVGFDEDRKVIRKQMDHLAATAKGIGQQQVLAQEQDGIETWMLEDPELRPKKGAGMYTLLRPASKVIATLYLFNQEQVAALPEFKAYREKLLTQVRNCLQKT